MTYFRSIREEDREEILAMMREFYSSEAVFSNGSEEIFNNDIDNCIKNDPYVEGYVFDDGERILGYAMVAKSYSTEFGRHCIWIEDIYVKEEHRGRGIGTLFLDHIASKYPGALFRLEVEEENEGAVHVYKKCGFDILPYMEMKREG